MVVFRSNDYPAILAFGTCIAIGILLSAATLIYLLTSEAKAGVPSNPEGIRNDLGFRILLAGLCAPIVLLFDIFHQAAPYGLALAAAVALGIPLLRRGLKARPNDIDAVLGVYLLRGFLLALVLFLATYGVIVQSPQPAPAGIAVWAVFYVAILGAWQLRGALAPHGNETT